MRRVLVWVFAAVVLAVGVSAQDEPLQTPSAEVAIPINGRLAIAGDLPGMAVGAEGNHLFVVDTIDGSTNLIAYYDRSISSLLWDVKGETLAFVSPPNIIQYDLSTQLTTNFPAPSIYEVDTIHDWSPTNDQLLNVSSGYFADEPPRFTASLEIISAETGEILQTLFTYSDDEPVTDVPLPASVSNFLFRQIRLARWNPVHPEWLLIQLSGYDDTQLDPISGYPMAFYVTFLYNLQTGEKLSVDVLFEGQIGSTDIQWDNTGEFLVILAYEGREDTTNIVHFAEVDAIRTLKRIKSAVSGYDVVLDWLGIDDMLIMRAAEGEDRVFYIAQIIDGVWHQAEFVRFPSDRFERVLEAAWHNDASPEESYSISCLFDSAQPTRLALGAAAQVNFTSGTPLRLRDAPDFDAEEITQIAEGTAFDVIGGPACVNGESYYRFWQVELADGTVGWAAEADSDEYFMEPNEGR